VERAFAFDVEVLLKTELRARGSLQSVGIAWADSAAESTPQRGGGGAEVHHLTAVTPSRKPNYVSLRHERSIQLFMGPVFPFNLLTNLASLEHTALYEFIILLLSIPFTIPFHKSNESRKSLAPIQYPIPGTLDPYTQKRIQI
jgi:hypothetical protein